MRRHTLTRFTPRTAALAAAALIGCTTQAGGGGGRGRPTAGSFHRPAAPPPTAPAATAAPIATTTAPAPTASGAPPARTTSTGAGGAPSATPPAGGAPAFEPPAIQGTIVFGSGTKSEGAFRGRAYVIPPGSKQLPDLTLMFPFALLYAKEWSVKSQEFSGGFPGALVQEEWFAIRYEGELQIKTAGAWKFRVTSDDGAILSLDGAVVVNNDGVHTAQSKEGTATLTAGAHTLRLDYFQAAKGKVALEVHATPPGGTERLLATTM